MPKNSEPSEKSETTETVTLPKSIVDDLLARIQKLESQPKADEVEISTDLPQAQSLQPGQYVNIAPPNQAPDLRKVRWTARSISETYPTVEFTAFINIVVAPHGIPYHLTAGETYKYPSIVKDFHDAEYQRQRHAFDRYAPESALEILEGIQRSKANKGVPVWGRLHIVGDGLAMEDNQPGVGLPNVAEVTADK